MRSTMRLWVGMVILLGALGPMVTAWAQPEDSSPAWESLALQAAGGLLGVLAGYAASSYEMARILVSDFRRIEEQLRRGEAPQPSFSPEPRFLLPSVAFSFLPAVLGVLAFNLL